MQPIMIFEPERMRRVGRRQRLRQSACFVELDIDGIVAFPQPLQRRAIMHAFIGADLKRPADPRQRLVLAGRQRLLDQRDADFGANRKILFEIAGRPCLVGINDELRFGGGPCAPP